MSSKFATTSYEYHTKIQGLGPSQAEFTHPPVGQGKSRRDSSTGRDYKETKSGLGSVKQIKQETDTAYVTEGAREYAPSTNAAYVESETLPPVYTENGSIIIESAQLEMQRPYRVILGSTKYIVVKNKKGDVDIYDCPSD